MSHLGAVGVSPLTTSFYSHQPLFVNVSQAGLGLEISMFLDGREVLALDDHVRFCESRFDVSFADAVVHADVGIAQFRVNQRRSGLHGGCRVRDDR